MMCISRSFSRTETNRKAEWNMIRTWVEVTMIKSRNSDPRIALIFFESLVALG